MLKNNKVTFLSFSVLVIAMVLSLFIDFYALPKREIYLDQPQHFYDMKKWYESKKFPVTGARFVGTAVIGEEYTTPRIPGGAYYIFYTLFYRLSGENLFIAKTINLFFNLIIISLFLFWLFKRFGFFVLAFSIAFILLNGYFVVAITDFWNPDITLMFSFLFFMLFMEYNFEKNKMLSSFSAVFMFPLLAIMAQGHFTVFFSMIPTLIMYLIIRFKKSKKNILFWSLGVFISFLLYLPYIITEFQNGFTNTNLMFALQGTSSFKGIPQLYALFIFPTNEMSVFYGTKVHSIIYYWFTKPVYIYGLIFLFISCLFSVFCFVKSVLFFIKTKKPLDIKSSVLKEAMMLYFLFFPCTVLAFLIFKSTPGTFRYLYSAFALSFTPIILFLVKSENFFNTEKYKKLIYIFSVLVILNIAAMFFGLTRYFSMFQAVRNENIMKEMTGIIENDSKGKSISIKSHFSGIVKNQYEDIIKIYFPNYGINIVNENPDITYIVYDIVAGKNWPSERIENELKEVYENYILIGKTGSLEIYKKK